MASLATARSAAVTASDIGFVGSEPTRGLAGCIGSLNGIESARRSARHCDPSLVHLVRNEFYHACTAKHAPGTRFADVEDVKKVAA
jgi:hypothetical protein